jgi:hypothetical protein
MSYLSTIKKLRLKTKWEEGSVDNRLSSPDAPWNLLIICGKENFIGLKSLKPPTVHYYHHGQLSTLRRESYEKIGGVIDQCDGEYMVNVPLKQLPELCKIVKAKKKRTISPEHLEKLRQAGKDFQFGHGSNEIKNSQGSTQEGEDG